MKRTNYDPTKEIECYQCHITRLIFCHDDFLSVYKNSDLYHKEYLTYDQVIERGKKSRKLLTHYMRGKHEIYKDRRIVKKQDRWGRKFWTFENITLKKRLRDFFHNKCWYTEVPLTGQDVHIDHHFRPKAAIRPFQEFKYNQQPKMKDITGWKTCPKIIGMLHLWR